MKSKGPPGFHFRHRLTDYRINKLANSRLLLSVSVLEIPPAGQSFFLSLCLALSVLLHLKCIYLDSERRHAVSSIGLYYTLSPFGVAAIPCTSCPLVQPAPRRALVPIPHKICCSLATTTTTTTTATTAVPLYVFGLSCACFCRYVPFLSGEARAFETNYRIGKDMGTYITGIRAF